MKPRTSLLRSVLFFLSRREKESKRWREGGELIVYVISLRTLLTALFVFCQTATKTVTPDLLMRAWVLSGCRFIPVHVQVLFCSAPSSSELRKNAKVWCVFGVAHEPSCTFCLAWKPTNPRTWKPTRTGCVPAGRTPQWQTQHRNYSRCLSEVFSEYVNECSCIQSAPGLCGQLPSFKGKATMWRAGCEEMDAGRERPGWDQGVCLQRWIIFYRCVIFTFHHLSCRA